uniref:Protein preY, mitochondrial n=1 Tax=Ursus americanus TaxID=9643 RepID=A0A452QYV9_URSAM
MLSARLGAVGSTRAAVRWRPYVPSPVGVRAGHQQEREDQGPALRLPLALLEFLVCPLSQEASQIYEAPANKLINEELGIAYPIIHGVLNMTPQAARMTHQNKKEEEMEQHQIIIKNNTSKFFFKSFIYLREREHDRGEGQKEKQALC